MGRPDFRCGTCGVNLGPDPWKGPPDENGQFHTICGCYPRKAEKMIARPSKEEKIQAILDARMPVAEYLQSIGKIEAFNEFTKDEIAGLIRAAVEGVQASLRAQCRDAFADDVNIPF